MTDHRITSYLTSGRGLETPSEPGTVDTTAGSLLRSDVRKGTAYEQRVPPSCLRVLKARRGH